MIKNKKKNLSKKPTKEVDKEYRRLTSKDLIRIDDKKSEEKKNEEKNENITKNNFRSVISKFKLHLNLRFVN